MDLSGWTVQRAALEKVKLRPGLAVERENPDGRSAERGSEQSQVVSARILVDFPRLADALSRAPEIAESARVLLRRTAEYAANFAAPRALAGRGC